MSVESPYEDDTDVSVGHKAPAMHRDKQLLRQLAHTARGILIALTLLAGATAGVWRWRPDLVDRADTYLTNRHFNQYQSRFYEARRLLRDDKVAGHLALEALIEELESFRRGDRLYPVKRDSVELLTTSLAEDEQWQRAAAWSERWINWGLPRDKKQVNEKDDQDKEEESKKETTKDVTARLSFARACLHLPDQAQTGRDELAALFHMVPESGDVARDYVSSLVESDQAAQAFQSIREYLRWQQSRFAGQCEFTYEKDGGLHVLHGSPFQQSDGTWHWSVELHTGANRVHIRLPQFEISQIRNPRLLVWNSATDENLIVEEAVAELTDSIRRDSGTWTVVGSDPDAALSTSNAVVSWSIPSELQSEHIVVSLAGDVVPRYPDWIVMALGLQKFTPEQVASDTSVQEDADLVNRFRLFRSDILRQCRLGLSWQSSGREQAQWAPVGGTTLGNQTHFDVKFVIDGSPPDLELRLPVISGAVFRLTKIELVDGETVIEVDPETVEAVSGTEKTADALQINSDPAVVLLPLPAVLMRIGHVRVEGTVE